MLHVCTTSCWPVFDMPPQSQSCHCLLWEFFWSGVLDLRTVSRWLGCPLRQTSIVRITVGWLLKRRFKPCSLSLLRDVLLLSCFHSVCPLRGPWEDRHVIKFLLILVTKHCKLISACFFFFFFGYRHLRAIVFP